MGQLKMLWEKQTPAPYPMKEGFHLATHTEDLISGWIEACYELNGNEYWTPEQFTERMLHHPDIRPEGIFYVIAPDGKVAGTATGCINKDNFGTLHMVCAHKDYKGYGAGKAVCTAVVQYFCEHGVQKADLLTDDFRIPAIAIYLSLGYRPFLYEADMQERWEKIMDILQLNEWEAYDPAEKKIRLFRK